MISKLKGNVEHIYAGKLIINVGDVGYEVLCAQNVLNKTSIGKEITLFISTQIKEQSIELFGFLDMQSKEMFLTLQSVSGVGAKMAIAFLDVYSQNQIKNMILLKQKDLLTKISGVGPKLAQRLILDLSDKISKMQVIEQEINFVDNKPAEDAVLALMKLGLQYSEAKNKVANVQNKFSKDLSTEELIKLSLQ
jgi:Holliday junction DNA helicase RuvA